MQISTDLKKVGESRNKENQSHTASTTLQQRQIQHRHTTHTGENNCVANTTTTKTVNLKAVSNHHPKTVSNHHQS
jgi:hypothetical protein